MLGGWSLMSCCFAFAIAAQLTSRTASPCSRGCHPGSRSSVIETGLNVVPSDRAYDLCLIIHFDSLDDLGTYQSHPDHVAVATYLRSAAESIGSVDYHPPASVA